MSVTSNRRRNVARLRWAAVLACGMFFSASGGTGARGQTTTRPADAPSDPPGAAAAGSTTQSAAAAATQPAAGTSTSRPIDGLNAKDLTVEAVLQQLSENSGFIIQKQAKDARLDTRVTLTSRQALMPDDLIAAINTALRPEKFTVIRRGRTLLVVALDDAKKGVPVRSGSDPEQIPENDNLVTQVIPIKTLDAVKLKQDLTPLVGPDADITSNAAGNSIIMTDTSANVRRIVQIIHDLDQQKAQDSDMQVIHLKYADADTAAKLVTTLFGDQQNQQNQQNPFARQMQFFRAMRGGGRGGGPGGGFPGGPPGGPPGGGGDGEESGNQQGKVIAASDTRTNTVVVTGPTETVQVVLNMLRQLDNDPSSEQNVFTYRVKNGQAANIANVLNVLFGNSSGGTTGSSTNNNTRTVGGGNSAFGGAGNSGRGGSSGLGGNTANRSTGGGGGGFQQAFGGGGGGIGGLSNASSKVASQLAGQVFVVADSDTNSLLITTATKYEKQVHDILNELDRAVPQVLIKVLVAEVTHDNNADFGTDFSILNTRTNNLGQGFGQTFGNPGTGLLVNIVENKLNMQLHALAQQNKLDVLSRPYILTSDNQAAEILVGQEVPLVTSNYTTDLGQIISNYQYQKVGIIVDVTPHINPDGLVTLDVAPEISQLSSQTVNVGPNVSAPVIDDRSASSRVAIRDGQTIVIGGLMQDQKTKTINKIPILGDIPLIGLAFSRTQVTVTKTELLIFLTPHVALEPDRLKPMSQDELRGTQLTPNAVAPGTFQDHLRGLQRGGSTTQPIVP